MKSILLRSSLLAWFAGSIAAANPVPFVPKPTHIEMYLEKVLIIIVGDRAKVSGTYNFKRTGPSYTHRLIYSPILLPVYGAKGVPPKEMTPKFKEDGDERWVEMSLVEPDEFVKTMGEMPQLDGQVVHWYVAETQAELLITRHVITLEMEYWQKLSNGKFIYTPLLPDMKEDHDYGEITIVADRPLKLMHANKHDFVEKQDRLVVEPFHKRAVVVEVSDEAMLP